MGKHVAARKMGMNNQLLRTDCFSLFCFGSGLGVDRSGNSEALKLEIAAITEKIVAENYLGEEWRRAVSLSNPAA